MAGARRFGIVTVLGLLAGGALLVGAPFAPATVRIAGVSLGWWYAAGASVLAATMTALVLACRPAAGAAPNA